MGNYHELPGLDRYGEHGMAGDLAEAKVAAVLAAMDRPVADFGPKRVDTKRAQQTTWPELVRYAPDFLGFGRFIECQGSNGEVVIFKAPKLEALMFWNTFMPVWFGIYDVRNDRVVFADLPAVLWATQHERSKGMVLDAGTKAEKEAFEVPLDLLYEVKYHNAFEAARVAAGKPKRFGAAK